MKSTCKLCFIQLCVSVCDTLHTSPTSFSDGHNTYFFMADRHIFQVQETKIYMCFTEYIVNVREWFGNNAVKYILKNYTETVE